MTTKGRRSLALQKALEIRSNYQNAIESVGKLHLAQGRFAESPGVAQTLQKRYSKSPGGYDLEGDVLMQQTRYAQALKAHQMALQTSEDGQLVVKAYMAEVRAET